MKNVSQPNVDPDKTRELLRGLSSWLETREGRLEAEIWGLATEDDGKLARILLNRMMEQRAS